MSWFQTRQNLRPFTGPGPLPGGVHIHRGRTVLFSSYVHFTAQPAVIAAIIQSKQLVEVPDGVDLPLYTERQRTQLPWGWWQPAAMSNPRFFHRHHESDAAEGWSEGWWVNGASNEVYAVIGS
jgi:hypothetical protein